MTTPTIKIYLRLLFIGNFALFMLNKSVIRPWVWSHNSPEIFNIFVGSFPNFAEAVLGMILMTAIFAEGHRRLGEFTGDQPAILTRLLALLVCSIYVISQELKIHNLGGNNIYDTYDLVASIAGLLITFAIIHLSGLYKTES